MTQKKPIRRIVFESGFSIETLDMTNCIVNNPLPWIKDAGFCTIKNPEGQVIDFTTRITYAKTRVKIHERYRPLKTNLNSIFDNGACL